MIDRFIARVGMFGAILILGLAVLVIGFGGGVVEHFRLAAAQNEQQGDQSGTQGESQAGDQGKSGSQQEDQAGTQGESQQGEQGKNGTDTEDQAGTQGESQAGENTTGSGQKAPQGSSTSKTK